MRIYAAKINKAEGINVTHSALVHFPVTANKNPVFKKAIDVI